MKRVYFQLLAPTLTVVAILFCVPVQAQVRFFSDPNYGGKSGQFGASLAENTASMASFGWDNRARSIQINPSDRPQPIHK